MLQHNMIWMDHHNFFLLFSLWMWFSPEWPHGSLVHLRATIENYLRSVCNQEYLIWCVSSAPDGLKSLSSLDYLDFPDAVQDRAFDPNRIWSLASSKPELLHFHTVWDICATMSIQERAENGSCVLMAACVCSGHAVCGDGQEVAFVLCVCV